MENEKKTNFKEIVRWLIVIAFLIFIIYSWVLNKNANQFLESGFLKQKSYKIISQNINESGNGYEIKGQIPLSDNVPAFNNYLIYLIQARIDSFKKDFAKVDKSVFPSTMQNITSTLWIDFSLITASPRMISLLLNSEEYILGMVHPMHSFYSVNYDLLKSKDIFLDDLFNVSSQDYLNILANYSKEDILRQIKSGNYESSLEYINQSGGLLPDLVNFKVFNITPSGLLITFSEYQVGPYVAGITNVNIPWIKIKEITNLSYVRSLVSF